MKVINTPAQYQKALTKIDLLLVKVGDDHSYDNPKFVMLDRLSELVADYEDKHHPIELPSLIEMVKLRMFEIGLNQSDLANLIGVPKTRVSEYLREKREITLDVARKLHHELN